MNTPHDPSEQLLQSLAEEAADLPLRAAREARSHQIRRARRKSSIALTVTALLVGACFWMTSFHREPQQPIVAVNSASPNPLPDRGPSPPKPASEPLLASQPRDFVKVQTEEEAIRNPLPLPEGLDQEQQGLFNAARGLPLLIVRNESGKVLRIHVIER